MKDTQIKISHLLIEIILDSIKKAFVITIILLLLSYFGYLIY